MKKGQAGGVTPACRERPTYPEERPAYQEGLFISYLHCSPGRVAHRESAVRVSNRRNTALFGLKNVFPVGIEFEAGLRWAVLSRVFISIEPEWSGNIRMAFL